MNVLTLLPSLRTQTRSNKETLHLPYSNPHQNPNNNSQHSHSVSVSVSVSLYLFLGNAGFDELVMLQRKKIIVKPLMRASRFLARLPDFYSTSRSQSTLSPRSNLPQFSGSETLDSSEELLLLKKKNVADDDSSRPPLQCDSNNTHFCGGRRSLISTLALRTSSSIPSVNYSQPPISLSELHLLRSNNHLYSFHRNFFTRPKQIKKLEEADDHSQRAVTTALWCNFLVFSLKFGVWLGTSSHVMLAEVIHSVADFANQALLAYGLSSSKRAPDALHPYGYSKERFVWSLISAVGIFCLGSGATIVHGVQNLWTSQPPENIQYAALVIGGSFLIEGASLVVAIHAVRKGAAAEGMTVRDFVWRGHDPTSVAVMTEDGAAVTGLLIAAASLVAVNTTGNAIYDPIGSIVVGNLLGLVAIFLIQRNRHALIGRAIDDHDMERVLNFLKNDPVVDAIYDCKSEVIGPGFFRFKAEIDFNGVVLVQNYLNRTGRIEWARQFREASNQKDDTALLKIMSNYGEEVVTALGSEVDRLEKEIQDIVPGIRHVDIEAHNPIVPL